MSKVPSNAGAMSSDTDDSVTSTPNEGEGTQINGGDFFGGQNTGAHGVINHTPETAAAVPDSILAQPMAPPAATNAVYRGSGTQINGGRFFGGMNTGTNGTINHTAGVVAAVQETEAQAAKVPPANIQAKKVSPADAAIRAAAKARVRV